MTEKAYIPEGKDILTVNGCTCKSEYKSESGNSYKNACNLDDATVPWCVVEGKCGRLLNNGKLKGKWWDQCAAKGEDITPIYGKNYFNQNLKGIFIYIVIFVITIPILMYRYGFNELLEVYMPNFDLLATAVSFGGGPGNTRIFQELYNTKSENLLGQLSTLFINYMSLLGLTYLVARRVNLTKSLAKGWGIGFVMLLLTYLIPNAIITFIQHKFADYFFNLKTGQNKTLFAYFSIVAVGLGIAGIFISIEKAIVKNHKTLIDPFVKNILHITDIFDKIFKI
jgi:hypothetical protein